MAELEREAEPDESYMPSLKKTDDPGRQLLYGLAYLDGVRTGNSVATAMYWLEQSAKAGNTTAMYVLGQIYENGYCTEKSPRTAAKWYRWGADKGNGPCAYNLAYLYESGTGLDRSDNLAFEFYRKASGSECDDDAKSDALFALGSMYADGIGTERSYDLALSTIKASADLGHAGAQFAVGKLLLKRKDDAEAARYLRMAADQGVGRALELLSAMD